MTRSTEIWPRNFPEIAARALTPHDIALFESDGFAVLRGFFTQGEIAPLRNACLADPSIGGRLRAVADSSGNAQEVIEWTDFTGDFLGVVPRLKRLIDGAQTLLGKPCYPWHSKLSMKAAHTDGRWDWHQDYPYWYDEGCLRPDMLTCMIGVDRATRENGCVTVIRGSHREPFATLCDSALTDRVWQDDEIWNEVVAGHLFNAIREDGRTNGYGYTVIKSNSR